MNRGIGMEGIGNRKSAGITSLFNTADAFQLNEETTWRKNANLAGKALFLFPIPHSLFPLPKRQYP